MTELIEAQTIRLCLVPEKYKGKCEGKKIERKNERKKKRGKIIMDLK